MKIASTIWDEFIAGKLTTKEAFDEINKSLKSGDKKEYVKLLKLSDKILDTDMPLKERDLEVEKTFWSVTHRESEE